MTEKRFRRVLGLIEDSNGDLLDLSEIADKMNQLNNENEELKKENQELRYFKLREETDDGSESQYADRRGVLHLMNQLADTNPNEQRHFYLKYRLDKVHNDNDLLRKENEQLKQSNQEAIDLILDGIVEMHDGKRDYAEKLLNEAIELIK